MMRHRRARGTGPDVPAGAPAARDLADAERHVRRLTDQADHPAGEVVDLTPSGQGFQRTHRSEDTQTWEEPVREAGAVRAGLVLPIGIVLMLALCVLAWLDDPAGSVDGWDAALVAGCLALLALWWRTEDDPPRRRRGDR